MYRKKYFFMCYMLIFQYMTLAKRAHVMNPQVIHFVVNHIFVNHLLFPDFRDTKKAAIRQPSKK